MTVRYCPRCGDLAPLGSPPCPHPDDAADVPLSIARQARLGYYRGQLCGLDWSYWNVVPFPTEEVRR